MNKYYQEKDYIHYSNCHEDPQILLKAIKTPCDNVLSIASAGDNTFSLLTAPVNHIVVFDRNPSQIALTKLKAAAFSVLTYEELLVFLGVNPGDSWGLFQKIKNHLDPDTRDYFLSHRFLIEEKKIIHCGRFESYFQIFRKKILRITHSKKTIQGFMKQKTVQDQWRYYSEKFNNRRWKLMFRIFFSKTLMAKLGRDREFFKYCPDNLAKCLKQRVEIGLQNVLNQENPYLQYAIENRFLALPHYLEQRNFDTIRNNIEKLEFVTGDVKTIASMQRHFDFFNLSDIFEYMSIEETRMCEAMIADMTNDSARIVFWNMMVRREFTDPVFQVIFSDDLFKSDKAFYYQHLRIYERVKV